MRQVFLAVLACALVNACVATAPEASKQPVRFTQKDQACLDRVQKTASAAFVENSHKRSGDIAIKFGVEIMLKHSAGIRECYISSDVSEMCESVLRADYSQGDENTYSCFVRFHDYLMAGMRPLLAVSEALAPINATLCSKDAEACDEIADDVSALLLSAQKTCEMTEGESDFDWGEFVDDYAIKLTGEAGDTDPTMSRASNLACRISDKFTRQASGEASCGGKRFSEVQAICEGAE